MYIHVCGIVECRIRDFVWLAGVRHLWGRDTGCMLKPVKFSFDTNQLKHTITLTNGTRSVDPQDASKICVHTRSIWYIRSLYAPREQSWLGITPFLTHRSTQMLQCNVGSVMATLYSDGVLAMKRNKHSNLIGQFKHRSHKFLWHLHLLDLLSPSPFCTCN